MIWWLTGVPTDFCPWCGACIPPRYGEGTCEYCDAEGVKRHTEELRPLLTDNDGARREGETASPSLRRKTDEKL